VTLGIPPRLDGRLHGIVLAGPRCRLVVGSVLLEVTLAADGLVKVRRTLAAAPAPEEPSPAVLAGAEDPALDAGWTDRGDGYLVGRAGPLGVEIDTATGLVRFLDVAGGLLLEEYDCTVGRAADAGGPAPQTLVMSATRGEQFYGLGQKVRGEHDTSLGWRGRVRSFGPYGNTREKTCPGVAGQGNGNTTIPLLVSSAGYGLFLDNHYRHTWDLTPDDRWSVEAERGEHRYWLVYGPDMAGVLARYGRLTGRAPMPPKWALGLLQSRFGYRSWDEVHAVADEYRRLGIPCDALILDLYWFGGVPHFGGAHRIGALEWDEAAFPEPAGHIARLRAQGFRLVLIEEPYVDDALPAHAEAAALGHLAVDDAGGAVTLEKWWGRGGIVDMTSPAAREWWWRRHAALIAQGVAGWWTDLGEPDTFDPESRYAGGRHVDVHNRYAMEWARALAEGYARDLPAERPYVLTRAGYAGIQRHGAALWSNDVMTSFEWLAPQVATGLNVGLSGLPWWGTDVGGFIGPVATPELYVRWFQFGAFSPVFRPHGQDRPTAPFEFGAEAMEICRRYARLRYRLLPYIYTAAREAHDSGLPLMRPLALEHPDDAHAADLGSEYLFGPSILVAPMLREGGAHPSRNVYLPRGHWVDFHTHRVYHGPTWLRDFPAPLDTLPLFVRAGAILPLADEAGASAHSGALAEDTLTLRVYPGAAASDYTLYEDDGRTTAYRAGACAWTRVACRPTARGVTIEVGGMAGAYDGMAPERELLLEVLLDAMPAAVRVDGEPCADWRWDPWTRLARVACPAADVRRHRRIEIL